MFHNVVLDPSQGTPVQDFYDVQHQVCQTAQLVLHTVTVLVAQHAQERQGQEAHVIVKEDLQHAQTVGDLGKVIYFMSLLKT